MKFICEKPKLALTHGGLDMSKCGLDECDLYGGCMHDCGITSTGNYWDDLPSIKRVGLPRHLQIMTALWKWKIKELKRSKGSNTNIKGD